jgi:hypothetical protein
VSGNLVDSGSNSILAKFGTSNRCPKDYKTVHETFWDAKGDRVKPWWQPVVAGTIPPENSLLEVQAKTKCWCLVLEDDEGPENVG